jgi:branched-chain amino acid transport system permease protein
MGKWQRRAGIALDGKRYVKDRFDMEQFAQTLADGVIVGAVYALVAVGFTLVYGVMRLVNFAHGGVFTIGAFATLFLVEHLGLPLIACIPFVAIIGGVLGFAMERLAYRPVRDAPMIVTLITALALLAIIENSLAAAFGSDPIFLPQSQMASHVYLLPFGVRVSTVQAAGIASSLVLLAVAHAAVNWTAIGRQMRARAEDRLLASTCGIDADRVTAFAFVLGGSLGTLGGMIIVLELGCDPYMGTVVGLKAFAGCVLGSIRSIWGGVAGAFGIGIGENFIAGYLSSEYKSALILAILALALLFFPNGLFAGPAARRV